MNLFKIENQIRPLDTNEIKSGANQLGINQWLAKNL